MPAKINRFSPSPALRSGSLRSPPLRAGEGEGEEGRHQPYNQQQRKVPNSFQDLTFPRPLAGILHARGAFRDVARVSNPLERKACPTACRLEMRAFVRERSGVRVGKA